MEKVKAKKLQDAIEKDLMPVMKGTYPDDKIPTHETIEKFGKDFVNNTLK